MKYRIRIPSLRENNDWIVEAKDRMEAAKKACPPNNDYWEYKVESFSYKRFQISRKLLKDPFGFTQHRKRNKVPLGAWVPYGKVFIVYDEDERIPNCEE